MNIKDYSPIIAISVQKEIIDNQRVTIEYWRAQVAELEAENKQLREVRDLADKMYQDHELYGWALPRSWWNELVRLLEATQKGGS